MANYLIVGGSSGIGLALCKSLLQVNHSVVASYRNTPFDFEHPNLRTFYWDSESTDWPEGIVPDVLDGLAYCPGLINLKPFHRLDRDDFKKDFGVQFLGAIEVIQQSLKSLKNAQAPSVVLFSTVAVGSGYPFHSLVSSSKGAIEGLTKSLAAEYAPKIRFNCVAPSITATPLSAKLLSSEVKTKHLGEGHPMKRIGTPADIANMVKFLLSDETSWVTGQVVRVDGGKSNLN